ncbi:hypothetical protein BDV93DRAFT_608259 [Ceratobasidium sp. AG-I]|nr:hypothetical protein BDV93DRAFT_608259 [Ceratobasidium sp. AG-I]
MTTTVQDILTRLRQPLSSLQELEDLLAIPLVSLKVLVNHPSASVCLDKSPNARQLASLQLTILAHIYPAWENRTPLIKSYFLPSKYELIQKSDEGPRTLALSALTVLTATPLSPFAIPLLENLVATCPLHAFWVMCHSSNKEDGLNWDGVVRCWMSVPGKVANALIGDKPGPSRTVPLGLDFNEFARETCLSTERIVWSVASRHAPQQPLESELEDLSQLLSKLVSTGHFSHPNPSSNFFPLVFSQIRTRQADVSPTHIEAYATLWPQVFQSLPGPLLQTLVTSLLMSIDSILLRPAHSLRPASPPLLGADTLPLHPSRILSLFLGPATNVPSEIWHVIIGSGKAWSPKLARSIVGWVAGTVDLVSADKKNGVDKKGKAFDAGLRLLGEQVLARWTDPQYISRSLLNEHRYLTGLLTLTFGALSSLSTFAASPTNGSDPFDTSTSPHSTPPSLPLQSSDSLPAAQPTGSKPPHPLLVSTSTSPTFLRAIGTYLSQRDESVRRCGMLVAEVVAGGKLNFGDWGDEVVGGGGEGTSVKEWQKWAAELRAKARDPLRAIEEEVGTWEMERPSVDVQPDSNSKASESDSATSLAPRPATDVTAEPANEAPTDTPSIPDPDSDDESLMGYGSPSPTSSRAPSPTPSELEDPTLRSRPIPRPVYLAELGAMLLEAPKNVVEVQAGAGFPGFGGTKGRRGMGITGGRGGGDAEDEKARVNMALEAGAELIRRRRGYGSELEENAVNLTFMFMRLQDNFELERFEERRQEVLVALVACCPSKAAPTIIEQFFHHEYSAAQCFTMLNAIAIGARELAGLPIPPPRDSQNEKRPRVDFPSKVLPGRAHLEYISASDLPPLPSTETSGRHRIEGMRSQVSDLVHDLSSTAITRSKQETENSVPQVVRERALKVGSRPGRSVVPLDSTRGSQSLATAPMALGYLSPQTPVVSFAQVAAEYFVAPLINRFWAHLRTSLERDAYGNTHRTGTGIRTGTGTGLVLSPLVLTHLLKTLAVLLHASRHATAFLHVLAPDAVELALAVGTRPLSQHRQPELGENGPGARAEAGVLAGALELALTVLDGAIEMDGGRVFALERAEVLVGVGQWASTVFEALDTGEKLPGQGGAEEEKAARIAAGVILTAERAMGRWRRSMMTM